jgi:hypothetical protein
LDKIFLNKGNAGILINRKNVTKETNLQHNEFKKWQESNKELKNWIDSSIKSKEQ